MSPAYGPYLGPAIVILRLSEERKLLGTHTGHMVAGGMLWGVLIVSLRDSGITWETGLWVCLWNYLDYLN